MSSYYSNKDSQEVRKLYYSKLVDGKKPDTRKMLITKKEWEEFKTQGRDMSRYEILKENFKRIRQSQHRDYMANLKHLQSINKEPAPRNKGPAQHEDTRE